MQRRIILFALTILIVLLVSGLALIAYGGVSGSKHDLSTATTSPCVYCHTPHGANTNPPMQKVPLWNVKQNVPATYQMYSSPTMSNPSPSTPSGYSLACLSCHDGSGTIGDGVHQIDYFHGPGLVDDINCNKCHPGSRPDQSGMYSDILLNAITTDLRNDHPISVPYPTSAQDPDFFTPPDTQKGWSDVPLYEGKIECGSCHDPHNPTNTPFLRKSNAGSGLCLTCHNK